MGNNQGPGMGHLHTGYRNPWNPGQYNSATDQTGAGKWQSGYGLPGQTWKRDKWH
jgi:hypothetical protein